METNKLPKLNVKIDEKNDKELFENFVRKGGVNYRKIFQAYPKLKSKLDQLRNEELGEVIYAFVEHLYFQHKSEVEKIVERESKVLEDASIIIFPGLEKVMGCRWDSSFEFLAIPTFLPFSPFWKDRFYFSIYGEVIKGEENKRRVDRIAIHELSHICWYQKLDEVHKKLDFKLNNAANYYLKEAFASIIGECDEFSKINKGRSLANYNTAILRVRVGSEEMGFVNYFRKVFEEGRRTRASFCSILEEVLKVCYSIQNTLDKKWSIWDKYGDDREKLLKMEYQSPINIPAKHS